MGYDLDDIDGIEPAVSAQLLSANIATTDDLLTFCADADGRAQVCARTGLDAAQLLGLTRFADLTRLSGVDPCTAELLEIAGIHGVEAMKRQNAIDLAEDLKRANAEHRIARMTPAASVIQRWIAQAEELPPCVLP